MTPRAATWMLLIVAAATACGAPADEHDAALPDATTPERDAGHPEDVDAAAAVDAALDSGSSAPVCGNGIVEDGETCDVVSDACVDCHTPCTFEGGRTCGDNGFPGDPNLLFECRAGVQVVIEDCDMPCERMPAGVPDRCPADEIPTSEIPAALIDALDARPYVEDDCTSVEHPSWPYEALRCTYTTGGVTATVTTATPSPERVARWIIESSLTIPRLAELRTSSPADWERALLRIARTVVQASSRIFPIEGGIVENLGSGYTTYPFRDGVTDGCSTGCYCRINSLHRTEWCTYVAGTGGSYDTCIAEVGDRGLTEGWGRQCLQTHVEAWTRDRNEHFRARAFRLGAAIDEDCPSAGSCTPAEVLSSLDGAL